MKKGKEKSTMLDRDLVIERIKAGEKQIELAREYKCTRQAISRIWRDHVTGKDQLVNRGQRGRPKTRLLTSEEQENFGNLLEKYGPAELGAESERWTPKSFRRAVKKQLGVSIPNSHTHTLMHQWNVFSPPTPEEDPYTGFYKPLDENDVAVDPYARLHTKENETNASENTADSAEKDGPEMVSYEEMKRVVEQYRASGTQPTRSAQAARGNRVGKHKKNQASGKKRKKRSKK